MRGKAAAIFRSTAPWRDHPRVCGEKRQSGARSCPLTQGSPPRVRGKVISCLQRGFAQSGSPPRMRGKDLLPASVRRCTRDHPRVCGEKCTFLAGRYICFEGSPPRMRGKDLLPALCGVVPGITPACAGKRSDIPSNAPDSESGITPACAGKRADYGTEKNI